MVTPNKNLIPERDAAEYLCVSAAWLQRQRWLNTGPTYVKVGTRAVRYRRDDLEAWVSANLRGRVTTEAAR